MTEEKAPNQALLTEEKELISSVKQGNQEAFAMLVQTYQQKIFTSTFRIVGNKFDAEDLTQEVFLRAYHSIKNFKEDCSFFTWIYKIMSNICLNFLREKKLARKTFWGEDLENNPLNLVAVETLTPEEVVIKKELQDYVQQAILKLPEEFKVAVVMRDIDGFSYKEIAQILKTNAGTVKSRIARGRKMLAELLKL